MRKNAGSRVNGCNMNIFTSGWLQRMVDRGASSPEARLQALFRILQDWADVPGFSEQLQQATQDTGAQQYLKDFFCRIARDAGVGQPDVMATQLHMMLLGGLSQELRMPGQGALRHAGDAAMTLLTLQRPRAHPMRRHAAVAAGLLMMASVLSLLLWPGQTGSMSETQIHLAQASLPAASPDRVSALYRMHEQVAAADCSYPQALMLAAEQRGPFIETVVNGNVDNVRLEAMPMVNQLYQKVNCYYPPAAMLL